MSSIWSRLINLAGNITGTLGVGNGGTGLTSGTSGGVPYFDSTSSMASSALLTNHAVVIGAGAAAAPKTIAAGTNGQLLVGSTGADPAFGSTVSALTTFSGGISVTSTASSFYQVSSTGTTFTFNGTGSPGTSASITLRYQRVGDWVYMFIPAVSATSGTSSTNMQSNSAIDTFARPVTSCGGTVSDIRNNGVDTTSPGWLSVNSSGIINIYRDAAATAFTNTSSCGVNSSFVFTYYVGTGS